MFGCCGGSLVVLLTVGGWAVGAGTGGADGLRSFFIGSTYGPPTLVAQPAPSNSQLFVLLQWTGCGRGEVVTSSVNEHLCDCPIRVLGVAA